MQQVVVGLVVFVGEYLFDVFFGYMNGGVQIGWFVVVVILVSLEIMVVVVFEWVQIVLV